MVDTDSPAWYYGHSTGLLHLDCQITQFNVNITLLLRMVWRELALGKVLLHAPVDSEIHWISANVQMERFYH